MSNENLHMQNKLEQNKLESTYLISLKVTIPEDSTLHPTLLIKLGKGSIYYNKLQDISPELKTIVNACIGQDIADLREVERLTNYISPNNT